MKKSRPILANFLASLVALIPMTLVSIHAWIFSDLLDDAPLKSSAFFFLALPFLYLIIFVFSYFHGKYLLGFGYIPLKKILIFTIFAILLLAIPGAVVLSNPDKFGLNDFYFSYLYLSGFILLSVLPSAVCWWYIACKPLETAT